MPGRQEPKKDVVHCEKRRGAVCRRGSGDVRMGKPGCLERQSPPAEHIGRRGEPGELKHLSTPRKREYSVSSGERKRRSPNRALRGAGL